MAKNDQATDLTAMEGEAQTTYASGLKAFGKQPFEAAIKATQKALTAVHKGEEDVKSFEQKIEEKKAGNAARLILLARECVVLTKDGDTVDLGRAADLMEGACSYVEAITVIDYRKRNPEADNVRIRNIVSSWPVLRSDFINAMRKAKLNPEDFVVQGKDDGKEIPQPSAMRKAYAEWKEKNPDQTSPKGRKPRQVTGPGAGQSVQAASPSDLGVMPLMDSVKSMLVGITAHLGQLNEAGQKKALDDILTPAYGAIVNLVNSGEFVVGPKAEDKEAAKDKAAGVTTRRRPMPARVPESNQIAS